jgi:hypothetical protein
MTVKDKNGKILTSENPSLIQIWQSAGYEEVTEKKSRKTAKETSEE